MTTIEEQLQYWKLEAAKAQKSLKFVTENYESLKVTCLRLQAERDQWRQRAFLAEEALNSQSE